MIVRKMIKEEFDSTIILTRYYCDEAAEAMPYLEEEFDENSIIDTVRTHSSQVNYCWFNAYDNNRPVGFIAGFISQCPWNKDILDANIHFLYLLESHRTLENFRELLNKFEEWARAYKCKNINAGDIGVNPERFKKIFERYGFKEKLLMTRGVEQ